MHPIDIKATTGCKAVELALIDLTSFQSILGFVDDLKYKFDITRLDALLLNAGMMTPKFQLTKDGWETTYVLHSHGDRGP